MNNTVDMDGGRAAGEIIPASASRRCCAGAMRR